MSTGFGIKGLCEALWAQCLGYGRLPVMVTVIVPGIVTLWLPVACCA